MIVVRNCFLAKPGQARKLAEMLKEMATASQIPVFRILTDITGDFNRVIFEYEAEDLAEFEARMRSIILGKGMAPVYHDLYTTGHREIFRVMQ
jgi:hypothetical protein